MKIVKIYKDRTLRIRKKIRLLVIEDDALIAFHVQWWAERFVSPSSLITLVRPVWHYIAGVSEGCYKTLRKIERKYGRVTYRLVRFDNLATVRTGKLEVTNKSLEIALDILLAELEARAEREWDETREAFTNSSQGKSKGMVIR